METEERRRWRFLEDFPAVSLPGWLPPAADCPELGDLRAEHERILAEGIEASHAAAELRRKHEAELEAVRAAHEQAFLSGTNVKVPKVTVTDTQLAQASAQVMAARDALQKFAIGAIETVRERESEVLAAHQEAHHQARIKRAEARVLIAEANRLEETPRRIGLWMDRICNRSNLGHFPYDQLEAPPAREPATLDSVLAGGTGEVLVNA